MQKRTSDEIVTSSFRDPSGFVFYKDGEIFRQINSIYRKNYDHFISSGLYEALVSAGLLVGHEEVDLPPQESDTAYKIIRPEPIPFISYPYEWCFSQLKDAALATLEIHDKALDFGMVLKDASAYNIQFRDGRPQFIDTLSFDIYSKGEPWVAYRQFCQHFLVPLALMSHRDIRLNQLLRVFVDGIPLDMAKNLLPFRTRLSLGLLLHIHLHGWSQARYAETSPREGTGTRNKTGRRGRFSIRAMRGLIESLRSAVKKLDWRSGRTEWGDYYSETNYSLESMRCKKKLVAEFLDKSTPKVLWDLGANTGVFSRIASERGIQTISFDIDPAAVERNYLECVEMGTRNLLPLMLDVTNPSPGIGWQNQERASILGRGPADTVLALALIHHLAISNNLPFGMIADFLAEVCRWLVIEFVPKSDSQVHRLLSSREDIFADYIQENFERAFQDLFILEDCRRIEGTERILYLMRKR
jgi:hypothetical protein